MSFYARRAFEEKIGSDGKRERRRRVFEARVGRETVENGMNGGEESQQPAALVGMLRVSAGIFIQHPVI